MKCRSLPLAALALLTACTVGPNYVAPPAGAPDSWVDGRPNGVAVSPTVPWWAEFHDPVLDRLVRRALAGNLDVQRAQAAVAEARAALREAKAGGMPQLTANANYANHSGGVGTTTPTYQHASSVAFDASWEIDLWGKTRRGVEAATANQGTAEANVDDAYLTLLGDVVRNYVRIRGGEASIAQLRASIEARRKAIHDTETRLALGDGSGLEVMQARTAVIESEAAIANLEAENRVAMNAVAILCGVAPSELGPLGGTAGRIPQALAPGLGVPADLVRRRPDVRAAERQLAQAVAEIGVAVADTYPSLTIGGNLTLNPSSIATIMAQPLLALTPSLSLPILDGGKRDAAIDGAKARAEGARIAYRQAVLKALQEVEDAMARLSGQRKTAEGQRRLQAAAVGQMKVARAAMLIGGEGYSVVIDAQRAVDSASQAVTVADTEVAVQTVALYKALGGGWAVR